MSEAKRGPHEHVALVVMTATVHETNRHGECLGDPVYKVGPSYAKIVGLDRNDCIRKLNEYVARAQGEQ